MITPRLTSTQAASAIYIDFEALKATPAQVGLLGVLVGADGEELEQLIVDERLAPGRVAKPRTRGADIRRVYVNALKLARPWRARLHPSFIVEREDRFSPKHTLDKYAVLAGYPGVKALKNATPATWIRHLLAQLQTQDGRYGQTTKQAKRDWHKLLDYNRHDLLALRHIVLKSARELELLP